MKKLLISLLLIIPIFMITLHVPNDARASMSFSKKYDKYFRKAVKEHWPIGMDWRRLKAQSIQESWLNDKAVSPVGAKGVMQFMDFTWSDMCRELSFGNVSAFDAKYAIKASAHYMYKLYRVWKAPRPDSDRWNLATASYNCGTGNMLKAQKKSGGKNRFKDIIAFLHLVTGDKNSHETRTYVKNIHKWHGMLLLGY